MIIIVLANWRQKAIDIYHNHSRLLFFLFFLIINLVLIKFSYISGIQYPLNSDSVIHTNIILNISRFGIPQAYYHYGFHLVIALLNLVSGIGQAKIILFYGQLLQVMAPITIYFPVYRITKNSKAALCTVIIMGFLWNMPSQVTSWGKYPSLMALVGYIFVGFSLYQIFNRNDYRIFQKLISLLFLAITLFIHSRMLFIFIATLLAYWSVKALYSLHFVNGRESILAILCYSILAIFMFIYFVIQPQKWNQALVSYSYLGIILVICSLPFGIKVYSKEILTIGLFLLWIFIFSIISLPKSLDIYQAVSPLDRPFLAIFLCIPFSIIIGLNLAAFNLTFEKKIMKWMLNAKADNQYLYRINLFSRVWFNSFYERRFTLLDLCIIGLFSIVIFSPNPRVMEPMSEVIFVSSKDEILFQKIGELLPKDAKILIPSSTPYYELGIDGGAWISYATNRVTVKYRYDLDFSASETISMICEMGAQYIYFGNKAYSFSPTGISKVRGYSLLINLGDIQLYSVNGCPIDYSFLHSTNYRNKNRHLSTILH